VLALQEVTREHTRKNLILYIIKVIYEYRIKKNLGYFVIDNTNNNNTMIEELSLIIYREFKVPYDTTYYRLHYQGHIINLSIKSFLFVIDEENIEKDEE